MTATRQQNLLPEMSSHVVTFGCRLNSYESEVIRRHLAAVGREVVVVNSCAVTAEAERQLRQTLRRLRRQYPRAEIIVTGCAAQINPQAYAALPEVDRVLGNKEKLRRESYVSSARSLSPVAEKNPAREKRKTAAGCPSPVPDNPDPDTPVDVMPMDVSSSHAFEGEEIPFLDSFPGRVRAFLQIQQGCDYRCSFCIIPFGRGPSRSVPVARIIKQAQTLVAAGHREIILTGVDLCSYGRDLAAQPRLGTLVDQILQHVPALPRLRLSSVDPAAIDPDLKRLFGQESRLMPHLHLSLQAGDDLILKRMKRRHRRQDVLDLCRELRELRPDIVFGADIIAGFPTESEDMFAHTLALIEEAGLTHLHVFPYSVRPGTPAARMPRIDPFVVKQRAAKLREAGRKRVITYAKTLIGSPLCVLVETPGFGYEAGLARVRLRPDIAPGRILSFIPHRIQQGKEGLWLMGQEVH